MNGTFVSQLCKVLTNLPTQGNHISLFNTQLHLSPLYLPEVQNLIDKPQHTVYIAPGYLHILCPALLQLSSFYDFFNRTGYQSQRCTELMRNISKKA